MPYLWLAHLMDLFRAEGVGGGVAMAGDWIKVRCDLPEDPAVIGIAGRTGLDEDAVLGKLVRLWRWANRQTKDGLAPVAKDWIDRYVGAAGFADAMILVGWLVVEDGLVVFPEFGKHNGKSAKDRLMACERMRRARNQLSSKSVAPEANICDVTVRACSPTVPLQLRRDVFRRDNCTCVYCGWHLKDNDEAKWREDLLSIDHIVPVSAGGLTQMDNLATACVGCNNSKSNRTPEQAGMPLAHLTDEARCALAQHFRTSVTNVALLEKRREEKRRRTPCSPPKGMSATSPALTEAKGFDEFWMAYPRKVARKLALERWRKLAPDDGLQTLILQALERARRSEQWLRDEGRFIPHPATWLNQRRWEDETGFLPLGESEEERRARVQAEAEARRREYQALQERIEKEKEDGCA